MSSGSMDSAAIQYHQPIITVWGGFLRSLENNVAIIRAIGFDTHIKIFQPSLYQRQPPLTILVENVRAYEITISQQGGSLYNIIRSKTSVIFEVEAHTVQTIHLRYAYQPAEFDFFFLGDIHGVFPHFRQIVQAANRWDPLFIMVNGDLTHSGHLEDYHRFSDILGNSHVPCFTSIGNHDKRAKGGRATYQKMLAPFYYSFCFADTKFLILDSSRKRGLQRFQYQWLERELQTAQGKRLFVILHRPPVCPKYNYLSFSATTNIRRFLTLMETHRVEMVFGSHIHVLTEFTRNDIRYVISGGGGGALWQPANIHHYLHVFVRKDGVELKVVQLPTPEAKVSQRLRDAIKFNVDFHLQRNKMFRPTRGTGRAEFRDKKQGPWLRRK